MAKTTRPRVKVGEWLECWAYGSEPKYGRVHGVVTKVDLYQGERRGSCCSAIFEMDIVQKDMQHIPEFYYVNEIVRRLRQHEIVVAKLRGACANSDSSAA